MIQAIVFLPLIGALIAGLLGRTIGHRPSEYITTGLLLVAAVLSWVVFLPVAFGGGLAGAVTDGHTAVLKVEIMRWIQVGDMDLRWTLRVDTLTAIMLVVVNTVSSLVHVYSIGYMADDPHRNRFFAYLSLFTFAMLMLVTADNFLQMFFGWEGVGLASYLLIGFWYTKPSANAAAMKAFVVNRVGDFGFALGIFGAFMVLGHIDFDGAFHAVPEAATATIRFLSWDLHAMTVVCLLLFMGAMGKSAQFLLHTWLPDAMEGPTPVSALIHAATMVTAGVFMVARFSPLFETSPTAMTVVLVIGAITAFFAATVGLVQNDIKRVIAYSTCSQLGYMFVALGAGAYSAGVFHLFTHAFFKALLFLGAGAVIHAMHHEQDMRNMGGLRHKIKITYVMMLIGTLALTGVGIPGIDFFWTGFAGFYSKDAIIEAAYAVGGNTGMFAFWLLVIAALFTSFYSWRLIHLTFHGTPRPAGHGHDDHAHDDHAHDDHAAHDDHGHHDHGSAYDHAHEAPKVMLIPLYVLAFGAVVAGAVFYGMFFHDVEHIEHFFAGSLVVDHEIIEAAHHVPLWVKWSATISMILGFVAAWYMYIRSPETPKRLAAQNPALYRFLLNKWYFDELYDRIFVKPALWIGRAVWKGFDDWLIDEKLTEGLGRRVQNVTSWATKLQSGYVYHYAFAMLIGIAALLTWAIVAGGLI
ncbi:NADH:ubiquinone oxidoreductase subunit L [Devosia yakushimensis]|uniref:NADH:ubiquinone oxidoreductase subunit L n=1 Tax=Devosia yakushimensis TaxID=470028 RepID=A0ABQ5UC19_9HYPH|nr:NADH-quinone oxidoreductase subunit L [Devosia yakushimensis]GLQ09518.1 NADH:ubiquinone oxidoreductase subunit L [Devosia yakushimensis]